MRKLVSVLAATTAIFAVTTVYCARQLYLARNAPVARESAVRSVAAPVSAAARDAVIPVASKAQAGAPADSTNTPNLRHRLGPYQMMILAKMADPASRRGLLEEQKAGLRRDSPYLAEYLRIGSNEFDAFLELVAAQRLSTYEKTLRCMQDPTCENFQTEPEKEQTLIQEIARGFGIAKAERYEHYLQTAGERVHVTEMRSELPDSERLTDTQAETLIDALADERIRIGDEITARSQIAGITLDGVPFLLYPGANVATLMEQANEYFRRMRERAEPLLTPRQLAAYDRANDVRLSRLPYMLRSLGQIADAPKP